VQIGTVSQTTKKVWFIWSIWFVWSIWFFG
jgi:hypothetical protein